MYRITIEGRRKKKQQPDSRKKVKMDGSVVPSIDANNK